MNRYDIIFLFGQGQVNKALFHAKNLGYSDLVRSFEQSLEFSKTQHSYNNWYLQDNGRVPGQQILEKWGPDFRQEEALRQVQNLFGRNLLDLGCADGSFCFFCLERSAVYNTTGIDLWKNGINWAKQHGAQYYGERCRFINSSIEGLREEELTGFDIVHIGEVLEHVIDPIEVLRKAVSLMRDPKGIVITIPIERPAISPDEATILTSGKPSEHLRLIKPETIESYAEQIGFLVSEEKIIGTGWVNFIATLTPME